MGREDLIVEVVATTGDDDKDDPILLDEVIYFESEEGCKANWNEIGSGSCRALNEFESSFFLFICCEIKVFEMEGVGVEISIGGFIHSDDNIEGVNVITVDFFDFLFVNIPFLAFKLFNSSSNS